MWVNNPDRIVIPDVVDNTVVPGMTVDTHLVALKKIEAGVVLIASTLDDLSEGYLYNHVVDGGDL